MVVSALIDLVLVKRMTPLQAKVTVPPCSRAVSSSASVQFETTPPKAVPTHVIQTKQVARFLNLITELTKVAHVWPRATVTYGESRLLVMSLLQRIPRRGFLMRPFRRSTTTKNDDQ